MTKSQALNAFWSSFGWPAINEQSDVDETTAHDMGLDVKRIEYEDSTGDYTGPVALTASLYHYSGAWTEVREKAQEIRDAIDQGYIAPIDGGYLWIKARNPFTIDSVPANAGWRRVILNIEVDYLTAK